MEEFFEYVRYMNFDLGKTRVKTTFQYYPGRCNPEYRVVLSADGVFSVAKNKYWGKAAKLAFIGFQRKIANREFQKQYRAIENEL